MHMLLRWMSKYERSLFILREPDTVMQYHIMGSKMKDKNTQKDREGFEAKDM